MPLNDAKGNMYSFVNKTWNTVKGKCPHDCAYCYMKRFGKQRDTYFDRKELKTDLGKNNFIFVGSSCDMWADAIDPAWIKHTLDHCDKFVNKYLFQSKNPKRIYYYSHMLPFNSVIGTTLETNRQYPQMGNAPNIGERSTYIRELANQKIDTMVTIEPIFDFDLEPFVNAIKYCHPQWVNIGADSGAHKLTEPPAEKVMELITELRKFTEVKPKKNLARILGKDNI